VCRKSGGKGGGQTVGGGQGVGRAPGETNALLAGREKRTPIKISPKKTIINVKGAKRIWREREFNRQNRNDDNAKRDKGGSR